MKLIAGSLKRSRLTIFLVTLTKKREKIQITKLRNRCGKGIWQNSTFMKKTLKTLEIASNNFLSMVENICKESCI